MAFIKVESEDMQIEETVRVKQEETEEQTNIAFIKEESEDVTIEQVIRVKQEDDEEQTNVSFIKEESENIMIEETFSLKQEENQEPINVSFNKEEREDIRTEEAFRVNHEDTEKQTVLPYQFEPESDPENADEQDDQSEHPLQARLQQDVSQWCRCENCNKMPSEVENVCCMEIPKVGRRMNQVSGPLKCIIHHPGFEPNCLNPYTLQNILNIYKADYGPLRRKTEAARYRYLAHRSFVSWCWGYLARNIRVVLPSCVVLRIQQEFPDADGQFVGFRPPLD
ncbi:probable inactive protein kinase DDB_G0270444 [Chanodichthys erythropterus]|uniref:probable inactive protein kinase DDB_G0270444 n=1 Tax=Chanodichthys erythropterus TaxID=933992 RepID=UPI00351E4D13